MVVVSQNNIGTVQKANPSQNVLRKKASLSPTCKVVKRKLKIENLVSKDPVRFIFTLNSSYVSEGLRGAAVDSTVKCHSWSTDYLPPL